MVTDITPALDALRAAHAQHMLMLAAHPRGNVEVEARAASLARTIAMLEGMPSRADLGVAREAMWEVAQYYALRDDVKLQARAAAIARVLEWVEELNALP